MSDMVTRAVTGGVIDTEGRVMKVFENIVR